MFPRSPVQAGEINKDSDRRKYSIGKTNKRREITVKDKAHHDASERFRIQIMSVYAAESSIANHSALECVHIQIMSIPAVDSSRAHHTTL